MKNKSRIWVPIVIILIVLSLLICVFGAVSCYSGYSMSEIIEFVFSPLFRFLMLIAMLVFLSQ